MLRQLNLTDLMASIIGQIEINTDLPVYDMPPIDAPAPFVFVELINIQNADTKTMYCKEYRVWAHVIAEEVNSSMPVYAYIQKVQEALSTNIRLPRDYYLVTQMDDGVQTIKKDESGEKHAVLQYTFKVAYGFKAKQNFGFPIYQ